MKKTVIISIVIAAVIGCVLGYAAGYFRGSGDVASSYAAKIAEVDKIFPASPTTTFSLSGQVKNISGNIVTIDANPITRNPFATGNFPAVREVTVTDATSITMMEQTDPAVYRKELADFQNATHGGPVSNTGNASSTIVPPLPFSETDIKLSDIKAGDAVTVTAASDILSAASFEATKIRVMPAAPTPTAAPAVTSSTK